MSTPTFPTGSRRGSRCALLVSLCLSLSLGSALVGCGGAAPAAMAPEAPMPSPAPMAAPSDAPVAAPADEGMAEAAPAMAMARQSSPAGPAPAAATGSPQGAKSASADPSRDQLAEAPMVVYQGELALRVDAGQGPAAIDAIVGLAESIGGHLAGRDDGRVVVKVPSRRFREAMSQVDATFEVERRSVKAEDVTAEFKDLEVRLENLRATRKRLEQLLEKSGTLADTLTVEKELERVAGEIDRIQGRIRFLRNHTSFSTLTVAIAERAKSTPVVAVTPTRPARRELAIPVAWVERVGVDALVDMPVAD